MTATQLPAPAATASARTRTPLVALLVADGTSLVGTRLSMIALPLFVLSTTGSATRTGLVAMAEMVPYVVAQALAGPVTDRVGPRRVSVVADLSSAVVVGLIPVLHLTDRLSFPALLALVALAGLLRGPGDGAKQLLAPGVADLAQTPIERVLGLTDGISRSASVIGPIAAAALVVALGPALAIAVDAASFLVCAVVLLVGTPRSLDRSGADENKDEDDGPYLVRLRAGWRFLRRDRLLLSMAGMIAVTNLLDAALTTVLLAVWARERGGGAGLMGAVAATMAAGAVLGAIAAAVAGHRLPRRLTFGVSFFLVGAPRFAVLALDAPLWMVLTVVFVGGIGTGTINPILGAVWFERIPENRRGSVLALANASAWTLLPFGGLVGGLLADSVGVSTALLVCGAAYLLATLTPALRPEWKEMDRARHAAEPPTHDDLPVTSAGVGR